MSVRTNVSGHGIGYQAAHAPYIERETATALSNLVTHIQARTRKSKFHHPTYLKEARFRSPIRC